jgi:DNA polymerase-1
MQEAFRAHKDIHALTAAEIFEVALEDVDKVQRKVGKTINFGIIYGMSGFGFADRLKVDVKVANDFIGKYFEEYPRVKEYFDSLIKNAKEQGFVETILGRRRSATDLRASNWHVRSGAEREVMNFPLQGGAADITKLAMLEVAKLLPDYPAKLALQVHDELVFEYDISLAKCAADEKFREFVTKTRKAMLSVIALKVPLEVGIEIGERWGDMRPLLL